MSAPRKFLLVGLTGGIATGKSTVSDILRRLGAEIIDADQLARDVVEPGEPAWTQIVEEFGPGVVNADRTLDRKKLGAIVFADPERRKRLEALTHPAIRERFLARLDELAAKGFAGLVVFDAAVMIESGNYKNMDRLVVVVTDEVTQASRLRARDGTDPAAVVFDAISSGRAKGRDPILIDTAGRLHTKTNLMDELAKLRRVIERQLPGAPHETLMVLDAPTGQNGFAQARMFHEAIGLTGVCLTKLDGTAKGGIVVRIVRELKVPVKLIGLGEKVGDLQAFDPSTFVDALVAEG